MHETIINYDLISFLRAGKTEISPTGKTKLNKKGKVGHKMWLQEQKKNNLKYKRQNCRRKQPHNSKWRFCLCLRFESNQCGGGGRRARHARSSQQPLATGGNGNVSTKRSKKAKYSKHNYVSHQRLTLYKCVFTTHELKQQNKQKNKHTNKTK